MIAQWGFATLVWTYNNLDMCVDVPEGWNIIISNHELFIISLQWTINIKFIHPSVETFN